MKSDYSKEASIFKAFCDENRLKILVLLSSGEMCGCKLIEALGVTQPNLSHHMKILCDSGVVEGRKDGKWTHYKISAEGRNYAINLLSEITKPEV